MNDRTERFKLGYVTDPLPGHEMFRGMIAIPYLRPGGLVASIRFRCIREECKAMGEGDFSSKENHEFHGKYNTVAGDRPRMYNTEDLVTSQDIIAICEGEMDTITAHLCGIPSVGIPGVQLWKKHFREPFLGYEAVFILADGDEPGRNFAAALKKDLPNGRIIPMPSGEDVNSLALANGKEALLERITA
jgi:5S rRNA maturation endonuclease (ribonuclease M5)